MMRDRRSRCSAPVSGPQRLLLAAALVATFAAVGREPAGTASPAGSRPLHVGLVTSTSGSGDPFAQAAIAGLHRAVRKLGVKAEVRTPTPREGYAAALKEFAKLHYDLVVALGPPSFGVRPDRVARRFPRVRFASLDTPRRAYPDPPANLTGIVFKRQEAGYLAGYLAGIVERRKRGPHIVSAIGGFPVPGVDSYIAGFRAGAKRADPRIRVVFGYSDSFSAPDICATLASDQIAKGSGVVFNVAGGCGLGALRAAGKLHVWGVGVDVDQSSFGPHILTSAVLHPGTALFDTIRTLQRHRYRQAADMVFGLRHDAVGLGTYSPRVPRSLISRVRRVRRQIVAGKVFVPVTLRR
jgi:basic membrane protein A and related proteins